MRPRGDTVVKQAKKGLGSQKSRVQFPVQGFISCVNMSFPLICKVRLSILKPQSGSKDFIVYYVQSLHGPQNINSGKGFCLRNLTFSVKLPAAQFSVKSAISQVIRSITSRNKILKVGRQKSQQEQNHLTLCNLYHDV